MNTNEIIQHLQLLPHPEGGYYRETYRSTETLTTSEGKSRNISTAIYYLLENDDKSHFHRIRSDEIWHFHQKDPLEIFMISQEEMVVKTLGNNFALGEVPQVVVPAGRWFAARVKNSSGYSLVSCTVAPGFDFTDFELATKENLIREFPHLKETIEIFT
ncbi:MAG: cupin domain-containing protein [Prolixibacteraceae bacterium]